MTLAFVHIPKTAGTSVRAGLENAFGEPGFELRPLWDPALGGWAPAEGDPTRHAWARGHLSAPKVMAWIPDGRYVTFLREGRTRVLSHWAFWRTRDEGIIPELWRQVARGPLSDLLTSTDPDIVEQVDNLSVRMLLEGHPLIPALGDGIIDPRDDEEVLAAAVEMLNRFDFFDVVENKRWVERFRAWSGLDFRLAHANETPRADADVRTDLAAHLTGQTVGLLGFLTRLDCALWKVVATRLMPDTDVDALADATFAAAVARHAVLLAPVS